MSVICLNGATLLSRVWSLFRFPSAPSSPSAFTVGIRQSVSEPTATLSSYRQSVSETFEATLSSAIIRQSVSEAKPFTVAIRQSVSQSTSCLSPSSSPSSGRSSLSSRRCSSSGHHSDSEFKSKFETYIEFEYNLDSTQRFDRLIESELKFKSYYVFQ